MAQPGAQDQPERKLREHRQADRKKSAAPRRLKRIFRLKQP